ncbi:MAG: DUF1585 domain-containing protein [Deltaproteobacteria bacterium]|nr:DUF1585 domain-containing protein [Deltaproteobacteria bacterium]
MPRSRLHNLAWQFRGASGWPRVVLARPAGTTAGEVLAVTRTPTLRHRLPVAVACAAWLGLAAASALAEVGPPTSAAPYCPIDPPLLDAAAHLRAASLDVRGTPPSIDEYDALPAAAKMTPEATLDAWLKSPAWAQRAVRRHRDLLWNSLANLSGRLMPPSSNLGVTYGLYYRSLAAPAVRGGTVPCLDEPVTLTDNGDIVFKAQPDGTKKEGYVLVNPYWNPTATIKVCAFDAQDNETSPNGTYCGATGALADLACGCGPNLRFCIGGGAGGVLVESLAASLDRQIQMWAEQGRPYTDLLTEKVLWVNGPIVHYLKFQAKTPGQLRLVPYAINVAKLPDLQWTAKDTWAPVLLDDGHAGILTHPAFLLRFQTQRARANRFFNVFLCQPFQAPDTGIPVDGISAVQEPDLQKRAGCKYCHVLLEPAAGFWGRWTPYGAGFLDPTTFPPQRDDCLTCALTGAGCSTECKLFYLTKAYAPPEKPWLGWLISYNYAQPQHLKHIDQGPTLLVKTALADNRLPRCVARTTAEWLLGRGLVADEAPWADQLAVQFATSNYDYRKLVKSVVLSDAYRRAP